MLQINHQNQIPPQLKNIGKIQSIELRGHLLGIVTSIMDVVQQTSHVEPDPVVTRLLDRYQSFLIESCRTPSLINKRARWLSTYGNVVLTKARTFQYKNMVFGTETMGQEHETFKESMIAFVEAISQFQTDDDEIVLTTLQQIMEIVENTKPNQRSSYYSAITDMTDRMTLFYTNLSKVGKKELDKAETLSLIAALGSLSKKMRHYNAYRRVVN